MANFTDENVFQWNQCSAIILKLQQLIHSIIQTIMHTSYILNFEKLISVSVLLIYYQYFFDVLSFLFFGTHLHKE